MASADPEVIRAKKIVELAKETWNSIDVDICGVPDLCHPAHTSEYVAEGDENGAWVKGWLWVSFVDTEFDKEALL